MQPLLIYILHIYNFKHMFTFQEDNENYGVDWDGPVPNNDEDLNINPHNCHERLEA